MGRNEIRLRRQMMSSGRIAQHRNYGEIMARHERDVKIKRVVKAFMYFLIIAFIVLLFLIVRSVQSKKDAPKNPAKTNSASLVITDCNGKIS